MLHLNRWNQHQLYLESTCTYQCLGCNLPKHTKIKPKSIIDSARKHNIVNIYGGDPCLNPSLIDYCRYFKKNNLTIRIWTNHTSIISMQKELKSLVDEWVFYCPSPDKEQFNSITGFDFFDYFVSSLNHFNGNISLSFYIRPLSFEWLPECYDLITQLNTKGMILYHPYEFNNEETLYITRFKRVKHMMVFKLRTQQHIHCFQVPNTIGSNQFEWVEWAYYTKQSLMKLPFLKRFT